MSSRKTKQRTPRHSSHSTPIPSTSRRDTTLPSRPAPHHSHNNHSSTYQALTPQVLHEHEHSQLTVHRDPTYLNTIHTQYNDQLDSGFDSLGVALPNSVQYRVLQNSVGMTPHQRFEADSTGPYQRYNSYEPVVPQQHTSYPQPQYSNVTHHQYEQSPASVHAAANSPNHNQVYYAPQQEYYYTPTTTYGEATNPGNDLSAVGTQFDGYVSTGYARTS